MASYQNPWLFNLKEFESSDIPEKSVGFVYLIEDRESEERYIGRKLWTASKTKQIKGKKKKTKIESDWKTYFGSSPLLKEKILTNGSDRYKRMILRICFSRSEMQYIESKFIFETDALLKNEYLNNWISCRINAKNLKDLNANQHQNMASDF